MADTTITIEAETKDRLSNYRHPDHDSWTAVLEGLMNMLPAVEDVQDGCTSCGETPWADVPSEDIGGFIQWFTHDIDDHTFYHTNYYCSSECVVEAVEEVQKYVPEHPDLVRVGGHTELVSEFQGASFYIDGHTTEVGIPIPGAFGGTDSFGAEYSYEGEPVYVKNEGEWIHSGVIADIIHEESHTGLLLEKDIEVEETNHPDEERRETYESESENESAE